MVQLKEIPVLVHRRTNPDTLARLVELFDARLFDGTVESIPQADRAAVRGMAIMGKVDAALMDALPQLEIISHFGVGYDGVDVAHAVSRGLMVTNTPDVLNDEVADTAVGLLLNTVREFPTAERHLREGRWTSGAYPLTPMTLRGRSIGIMGLGRIGLAVAKRLEAFGLPIAYHNRKPRTDVAYRYLPTLKDLAEAVDTLVIVAPGGAETDRAVNADILQALGPNGVLINVGRGTIVDEEALVEALESGTIRAAGLDVFAREPHVPERLLALPNAVLLPHVASASRATRQAMGQLVIDNLAEWFAKGEAITPVPEVSAAGHVDRKRD
ncbi:2-hydroxyacid dehydrogenase [Mangrovibrevibacter kandeliae]|uniref:2-hydroxyacid dehydrogenase n=1 Tax=Mangrovibrevibacter kandeliae TaxID=2968473 RepID=UPI0021195FAF|nr:2-hydroxyacid dehydrogenase [Aurantimonas sp. CSK15Z-1]MCQ8782010.1 2-hydroxyacid dehydrogenase [Aurantimonas sp. CSK15Z-1]